ncbi:BatA domain-containing protein [candidate division KSB1 bacterium]|nr:BatA domain-containing protein [candidate division KSB1 bacterium]
MTFLNTFLLFGLAAAILPILIHLFTRQKLKKIKFSSLEFLKAMQREKIRRVKLRQIFLLILRTLIILFLVLTFARPALRGSMSSMVTSNAKTSIAIILDNSLSMSRENQDSQLFDLARQEALKVIDAINPGDEVYILQAGNPGTATLIGPKYTPEAIKRLIQNMTLSYHSTHFLDALLVAQTVLLESKNINREIYLIGDLQQTGFRMLNETSPLLLEPNIRCYVIPLIEQAESNLGIETVRLANQIFEKGKTAQIDALIRNYGKTKALNKLVQLFIDGRRSAQTLINLQAGEVQKISFSFVPENTGHQSGYLLLEEDELSRDNQRFFSFYVPPEINVLLVGGRETDLNNLKTALNPAHEKISTIATFTCLSDEILAQRLSRFHTLILSNVPKLDGAALQNVYDFVQSGGGLILFLGSDVDARLYNDSFFKRFELPTLTEPVGTIGNKGSFISFGKVDFSHPIFRNIFEREQKQIDSPQFYFSFKTRQNKTIEPIIGYDNDYPCLYEARSGKGKMLVFTTSLDYAWSNLALKGIFVPLMHRSVAYLAGSAEVASEELLVGEEISHSSVDVEGQWQLEMKLPDESISRIRPIIQKEKILVQFSGTELPGVYELLNRSEKIGQWAVNVDPNESNTESLGSDELHELLGKENVMIIGNTANLAKTLEELRFGQELWKVTLALVLIFLIVEMLLYREKISPLEIPAEGTNDRQGAV